MPFEAGVQACAEGEGGVQDIHCEAAAREENQVGTEVYVTGRLRLQVSDSAGTVLPGLTVTDSSLLMPFLSIQVWESASLGQSDAYALAGRIVTERAWHANSAETINLFSSGVTPETCSIDILYLP